MIHVATARPSPTWLVSGLSAGSLGDAVFEDAGYFCVDTPAGEMIRLAELFPHRARRSSGLLVPSACGADFDGLGRCR